MLGLLGHLLESSQEAVLDYVGITSPVIAEPLYHEEVYRHLSNYAVEVASVGITSSALLTFSLYKLASSCLASEGKHTNIEAKEAIKPR